MNREVYQPSASYFRVGSACPEVSVGDIATNIERIKALYAEAAGAQVNIVTFPEMSLSGYTLGDLVQQSSLLGQAREGLAELAKATAESQTAMVVGLPLAVGNGLYNCAAVVAEGRVAGIVPKVNLPTYNEFYERRWFKSWHENNTTVPIGDEQVPFGTELLFDIAGVKCGVEICEDLWVPIQPSQKLAEYGARVILNPSASPEQIGKTEKRRDLVRVQSGRLIVGYVYSGCDVSESTSEIVMGGHQLIASYGQILAEREPFSEERLIFGDIDIEHLDYERRKSHMEYTSPAAVIKSGRPIGREDLRLTVERNPFLPTETSEQRNLRLKTALEIQANGLVKRLRSTGQKKLVLGLSGGLDSTLALVVASEAAQLMGMAPSELLTTLTMPGPASSNKTQGNAQKLAAALGIENLLIPIAGIAERELAAIGHDGVTQNATYENLQARARTATLFNYGNMVGALVLGTGDLSEIALGWCTYNGDQQSHYNVNSSIPKTMVKSLVEYASGLERYKPAKNILKSIVATPISPELTSEQSGQISQLTEDLIGPYELHDFFLYHLVRWGDSPAKIAFLATQAFGSDYSDQEIKHWLRVFIDRFAKNQFKRENIPNGPKVGSVSLSPRGDWRMPPDLLNAAIWES